MIDNFNEKKVTLHAYTDHSNKYMRDKIINH